MRKCAVTPRKDAVIPGFNKISAHILMITALLNNDRKLLFDEVLDIFYPFLEVIHGLSTKERAHW